MKISIVVVYATFLFYANLTLSHERQDLKKKEPDLKGNQGYGGKYPNTFNLRVLQVSDLPNFEKIKTFCNLYLHHLRKNNQMLHHKKIVNFPLQYH